MAERGGVMTAVLVEFRHGRQLVKSCYFTPLPGMSDGEIVADAMYATRPGFDVDATVYRRSPQGDWISNRPLWVP